MHQQWVEENDVSFLHLQVQAESRLLLVVVDSEIRLVDLSLPLWVNVSVELLSVGLREDVQRSVLLIRVFQTRPGCYYVVGWSEWEVGEILMEWMSRAGAHVWRLVDKHGVN